MSTLAEMLRRSTDLEPAESEWLHLLVGDWQLIADLSFADLVLWVRGGAQGWIAVGHVRPNTGPMVFYDDIVGSPSSSARAVILDEAARTGSIIAKPGPTIRDDMSIREDAVPVARGGRTIAVITRHSNLTRGRTPSRLELTYRDLADSLMRMVAAEDFPSVSAPTGMRRGAPRVGDGVMHLDAEGVVRYASPNAVSAVHRMGHLGDVVGEILAQIVADVAARSGHSVDESLAVVAMGRAAWRSEVETEAAVVSLRAIPLVVNKTRNGAMLLLRDVSELRRREQELLTKDATIREIHHRVKNNLQTVAALLRLQSRRVPEEGARAALAEAVRRVGTIAMVHDTLSHGFDETVNFDEIALRGLRAVVEVATQENHVESSITGSFGRVRAEDATALAMIISELVQNAVEHGLDRRDGAIEVSVNRHPAEDGEELLTVTVTDDGIGLPAGFRPGMAGLGTRIVTSFVQDLRGRIRWEKNAPTGTKVEFVARLRSVSR
ncbi:MAG: sensor histidine kinase [Ornithinibacter sp.]